jgi:hypothetical protein
MFPNTNTKVFGVIILTAALLALASSCGSQAGITKGVSATYTISGIVYFDANANAVFDAGDVPIHGQTVAIVNNSVNPPVVECQALTNSLGRYELSATGSMIGQLMFTGREKGDDYIPPCVLIYDGGCQDMVQDFRTLVLPTT